MTCFVCKAKAHHEINGLSFCCKHFDEAVEHGAGVPANFAELAYLAEIGSSAILRLLKQEEVRRKNLCAESPSQS